MLGFTRDCGVNFRILFLDLRLATMPGKRDPNNLLPYMVVGNDRDFHPMGSNPYESVKNHQKTKTSFSQTRDLHKETPKACMHMQL